MKSPVAKAALCAAALTLVSGCGLPRSGPSKREIFSGSVQREGDAFIVSVTDRVSRLTRSHPGLGFSAEFVNAGNLGTDTIRPGDTLGFTIYENVEDGLLVPQGAPSTTLTEIQVDSHGFIYIPYAGIIRAAGNTPDAIRRVITERLGSQTPDPQVIVRRLAGDGAAVTVIGGVGAKGNYPIERPTRTLSGMLAAAGGLVIPEEVAQVTVVRGNRREKVWFQDVFLHPSYDIALRDGDKILVEQDARSFTAMGATGGQALVPFERQTISAIEAIAQVGGLNSALADPTGVFVFRRESEAVARKILGRADLHGSQRLVYVLDLTRPNGMFEAREFTIRDGDTVYVTEAPYVQWQKSLSALTGTVGTATQVAAIGGSD